MKEEERGTEEGREDDKLYTATREEGKEGGRKGQVTDSRELTPP